MRKILLILPLLALVGAMASPYRSPEEKAEVLRKVRLRADSGDPEALYHLSQLYERGYDSIPGDSLLADSLLQRSAAAGYLPAQNYLGYQRIRAGKPDEGLQWLERAAIAGDPKAQSNIGYLLLEGKQVQPDDEKAAFWLRRASDAGVAAASSMLGDLYRDGRGVPQDSTEAAALYRAALDAGLTVAAYKLQALEAERWMTLSAPEQLDVALYLYPARAPQVAIPLLERLASGNDDIPAPFRARALALLGDACTRALGVAYDHDRSLRYYWESARLGYAPAQFVVSELLEIFPDALDPLTSLPPTADELRSAAAIGGVTTAAEATAMLFGNDLQ